MARSGIYKSEVIRARDKLVAMGRYPSIDAVRQELGNTGSKATIHRYLKEIEEEEGGKVGTKVAISESLHDLVARLAGRLNEEADSRIQELNAQHASEMSQQREVQSKIEAEAARLREALEKCMSDLAEERARHQNTSELLQREMTVRATANQKISDMEDRLQAEEEHRRSLEEKHASAREALEHFRAASKDQREQEQRQHEQQVLYLQGELKNLGARLLQAQHEITAINQEGARLTSQLAQSERSLHEARAEIRDLKSAKAELDSATQRLHQLERQVVELESRLSAANDLNSELEADRTNDQAEIRRLQLDLAASQAAAETHDQFAAKIQAWISQTPKPTTDGPSVNQR